MRAHTNTKVSVMVAESRCDATNTAAMRNCSEEGQKGGLESHHRPGMVRQQILVNGRWITVAGSLDMMTEKENGNEEVCTLDNKTSQLLHIGAEIDETKDDICSPMSVKIEGPIDEDEEKVNMAMQDAVDELHKNHLTNLDTSEGCEHQQGRIGWHERTRWHAQRLYFIGRHGVVEGSLLPDEG